MLKKLKYYKNKFSRVELINYTILLYAFSLSLPVHIKTPFIILLLLLSLTDKKFYRFKSTADNKIFLFMALFFLYVVLSSFWSDATVKEIFINIKKYWYYLPIFIIYKYIKKEYIGYAINAFILGMLLSEILSYGNFFNLWEIKFGNHSNPTVFLNHTQYSIFLSITSIILFTKGLYEKNKILKISYFFFFFTVTLNLFINSGRTGYVTFLLTIIFIAITVYRPTIKTFFIGIVLLGIFLISIYNFTPNFKMRINNAKQDIKALQLNSNFNSPVGARIGLWIVAKNLFIQHPILGVGVANNLHAKNNFLKETSDKKLKVLARFIHFHNSFLEILVQFGIIGLTMFLYILYLVSKIEIKDIRYKVLKYSLLSIFILSSFTDIVFYLNSTMSLFAFMLGLILAQSKAETKKDIMST